MIARMDVVQNAARMAMADHRAADPAFPRPRPGRGARQLMVVWLPVAATLAAVLLLTGQD